jgi:23S rRNA (guanosine2251-2'-O)-methyltransferase
MEHVEGRQSVFAALQARQRRIEVVLVGHGTHEEKIAELIAQAESQGIPVKRVDRGELDQMAHGASHGGVVAVCSEKPRMNGDALLQMIFGIPSPLLLLLEGVDDARNLGFTLRSAEALGVHAVLIKKHLWDFDAADVARSSSGAYERMPLAQIEDVGPLKDLQKLGIRLYGCLAGVKRTIYDTDLTRGVILAIGGEKRGLSGAVRNICDKFLTIPTIEGGSSLSLSHAGAICLAEAHRQRLQKSQPSPSESPERDNG